VRRLKTQLDQYTDLTEENRNTTEQVLPRDNVLGFRGVYAQLPEVLRNRSKQFCDLAR
jgi:type I restriction enzyme R subunit